MSLNKTFPSFPLHGYTGKQQEKNSTAGNGMANNLKQQQHFSVLAMQAKIKPKSTKANHYQEDVNYKTTKILQ